MDNHTAALSTANHRLNLICRHFLEFLHVCIFILKTANNVVVIDNLNVACAVYIGALSEKLDEFIVFCIAVDDDRLTLFKSNACMKQQIGIFDKFFSVHNGLQGGFIYVFII